MTASYLIAMISSNMIFVSVSLQYIGVFLLMFAALILYMRLSDGLLRAKGALALFFLVLGSAVCFVDFLTCPLVALGVPLCIMLTTRREQRGSTVPKNMLFCAVNIAFFAAAYALTFLAKWTIATLLWRRGAFLRALGEFFYRVGGSEQDPVDRWKMLCANVKAMVGLQKFSPKGIGIAALLVLLCGVVCFVLRQTVRKKSARPAENKACILIPLLLLALSPYVWYMIFANHSQVHWWMTWRNQIITVFALTYFYLSGVFLAPLGRNRRKAGLSSDHAEENAHGLSENGENSATV